MAPVAPPFLHTVKRRPLRREGAVIFTHPAEQAMDATRQSSSLPPMSVLGKHSRSEADSKDQGDGGDTEPEDNPGTVRAKLTHSTRPTSIGDVADAASGRVARKRPRPEQLHDGVDTFLIVSSIIKRLLDISECCVRTQPLVGKERILRI